MIFEFVPHLPPKSRLRPCVMASDRMGVPVSEQEVLTEEEHSELLGSEVAEEYEQLQRRMKVRLHALNISLIGDFPSTSAG